MKSPANGPQSTDAAEVIVQFEVEMLALFDVTKAVPARVHRDVHVLVGVRRVLGLVGDRRRRRA